MYTGLPVPALAAWSSAALPIGVDAGYRAKLLQPGAQLPSRIFTRVCAEESDCRYSVPERLLTLSQWTVSRARGINGRILCALHTIVHVFRFLGRGGDGLGNANCASFCSGAYVFRIAMLSRVVWASGSQKCAWQSIGWRDLRFAANQKARAGKAFATPSGPRGLICPGPGRSTSALRLAAPCCRCTR